MNYIALNVLVLALIVVAYFVMQPPVRLKQLLLTIGLMLLMTAVFDNVIIWLGIVAYHPSTLLGLYVGRVPVEDFAYALGAGLLVPLLWGRK